MDDEDGTCLLDVLCDPQALNDFLHGTNELQTEDLLITAPSGEPILFTDAPSPVSLLGDGRDSPDMPPPSCVDLSFLEEALLSSPEGREDLQVEQDGSPVEAVFEEKKAEVEEVEEACDILRQSLQEAEITEQTMALEADLGPTGENLSLYSPAPLLSPPILPFTPKSLTLPITSALPRDTQAVVEPPQPSLLAVGPGCPSLKPAAPPQLMGLLPGNVFPIPSPETSFSPSPAQGSTMIIHKSVPSITSRPLITPTLRAAATAVASTPGVVLQRAPLPIQPKLPISIQPRLVQISPKPSGKKPPPGLTFVPGTASSSILLSQSPGQKKIIPPAQNGQQFPKPVSLQLVNQGGSLVLQPQGLYHGQNHFLLPGQSPVTISQAASTAGPLLTPSQQGPSVHSMAPPTGQLVDGSQILTVPPRQLNFSPVFTTPTGQLALRQASVLSGPLQLQSAPTAVFQMPAQVAGAYTPGGLAQPATLVHSPALANHITFINSSGVLPSDLTSISIVNGPPVVRGLPLAAQTAAAHMDGRLSVQQASVVLLPEETSSADHTVHQLQQSYAHVVQQVSVQPTSSPPAVTVLQSPPEPPPAVKRTPADVSQVEDEVTESLSQNQNQNQNFTQHVQQEALHSPVMSELLVAAPPAVSVETPVSLAVSVETPVSLAVSVETLASPAAECTETRCACPAVSSQDSQPIMLDQCVESDSQDAASICSPDPTRDTGRPAGPESLPEPDSPVSQTTTTPQCIQAHVQKLQASDNEPAAASVDDSPSFAHDVHPPPAVAPVQRPPLQPSQQSNKLAGDLDQKTDERVTTAGRRRRFHQQVCLDQAAVQSPSAGSAFSTLRDAVGRLLPYHSCAGHLPTEDAFSQVDQEFHAVSAVLLKRTKDMVNKYRQLLLGEAQQDSPSAEMVMLERLFLQVERCALAEDRRRTRRDPETFMTALATSASSPQSGPPSPPAWTRLSDRPPGLKTYRSSSRGALRLTIRQELGSRKVVHNSACGTSLKRDHTGQPANGAAAVTKHRSQTPHGRLWHSQQDRDTSHGKSAEDVLQRAPASTTQSPPCVSGTEPEDHSSQSPPTDVSAPKHKRCQLDVCPAPERRFSPPPAPERRFSPPPAPIPEDGLLSEHLQSAIDSILELQRLQGPSAAPGGPLLDQPVTSILQGPL